MRIRRLAVVACAGAFWMSACVHTPPEREGLPLVYENDFEKGIEGFVMTDPKAWAPVKDGENGVLGLVAASEYEPAVRSPLNIARIEGLNLSDFVLEAKLKQTGRQYNHRDLCIFFGYVDPTHFYYVHMATVADPNANSIFLVNGAPRTSVAKERTDGTKWEDRYHTVRVSRNGESGDVKVFFDDVQIMSTVDKTFPVGGIGFGSFDDVGQFDDVKIWGKKVTK